MKLSHIATIALFSFGVGANAQNKLLRGVGTEREDNIQANSKSNTAVAKKVAEAASRGSYARNLALRGWAGGEDLALNQPVYVSSTYRNWKIYAPWRIVDGDSGSRWTSNYEDDQWIIVDLGKDYAIDRVRIGWEDAHAQSYELKVSSDKVRWTTVYSTNACEGGVEDVIFSSHSGRYVRMNLLTRATRYGFSLWDFEVYEAENEPEPTEPTPQEHKEEFIAFPSIFQEVLDPGNPCNVAESSEFVGGGGEVLLELYNDKICLKSTLELVGTETKYHIHNGPLRENGDLLFDLTDKVFLGTEEKEVCVGLYENMLGMSDSEVRSIFHNRQTYTNHHTEECPEGEQRGQIVPLVDYD